MWGAADALYISAHPVAMSRRIGLTRPLVFAGLSALLNGDLTNDDDDDIYLTRSTAGQGGCGSDLDGGCGGALPRSLFAGTIQLSCFFFFFRRQKERGKALGKHVVGEYICGMVARAQGSP
jgi:hypothetical protein